MCFAENKAISLEGEVDPLRIGEGPYLMNANPWGNPGTRSNAWPRIDINGKTF